VNARRGGMGRGGFAGGIAELFPSLSPAVIGIIVVNVVAYILELVAFRAGASAGVALLMLTPQLGPLFCWQVLTAPLIHDPGNASHLLFNMLCVWIFAPGLEAIWGTRKMLFTYGVGAIGGGLFTLLLGALHAVPGIGTAFQGIWETPTMGSGGAVLGLMFAWGVLHWRQTVNFLFLGAMKGWAFLAIWLAVELIIALSLGNMDSTMRIGGALAGGLYASDLWRFSSLRQRIADRRANAAQRDLDRKMSKFKVIEGGRHGSQRKKSRDDDWVN
jgi:membrane associated rhomboid family serine protease